MLRSAASHLRLYCCLCPINRMLKGVNSQGSYVYRDERDSSDGRPARTSGAGAGSGSSDQQGQGSGSAFEAYKQPLSTFGKSEQNGPQPVLNEEDLKSLPRYVQLNLF